MGHAADLARQKEMESGGLRIHAGSQIDRKVAWKSDFAAPGTMPSCQKGTTNLRKLRGQVVPKGLRGGYGRVKRQIGEEQEKRRISGKKKRNPPHPKGRRALGKGSELAFRNIGNLGGRAAQIAA